MVVDARGSGGVKMCHHLVFGACKQHWRLQDGRVADIFEMTVEEAQAVGFSLVGFVALVDHETSTYFAELVEHDRDFDLWDFLTRAWKKCGGLPYALKVKASAAHRLPWLEVACRQSGVGVSWVKGDKRHIAKSRHAEGHLAQSYWHGVGRLTGEESTFSKYDQPKVLESMRPLSAWRVDYGKPAFGGAGWLESMPLRSLQAYTGGSLRTNETDLPNQALIPTGRAAAAVEWLREKGQLTEDELREYEAAVQHAATTSDGSMTGELYREDSGQWDLRETIDGLLACWPESEAVVAGRCGIKQSQLRMYLSRRQALTRPQLTALRRELSIEIEDGLSKLDGSVLYETMGHYVLFPSGALHKVVRAYQALCRGGDLMFCAEVAPFANRVPGPWRIVVMLAYDVDALFVIGRGSRHERLISRDRLINMGREVYKVPTGLYEDLVRLAESKDLGHAQLATMFEELVEKHEQAFEAMRSLDMGTSGL